MSATAQDQAPERRSERIDLRLTPREKRLLQAAAGHERTDLSRFILRRAVRDAEEVTRRAERRSLSERDARRLLELLEHPPAPSAALCKAALAKPGR